MSTKRGSHFRTVATGRELRVRLMAACGASIRFMAEAEGCAYVTIRNLLSKKGIEHVRVINWSPPGSVNPVVPREHRAAPEFHALDQWMHEKAAA